MFLKKSSLSIIAAMVVALAGCSSGTNLDRPANADAQGTTGDGADASATANRGLTGSELEAGQVPRGLARVYYFDFDSYVVRSEYQPALEAQAQFLKNNPSRAVLLEGHTDERGGREYNLALGQRRAEAIQRSLSLLGVGASQMESVSYGKERPAAFGSDEHSMSLNRRVEINYR